MRGWERPGAVVDERRPRRRFDACCATYPATARRRGHLDASSAFGTAQVTQSRPALLPRPLGERLRIEASVEEIFSIAGHSLTPGAEEIGGTAPCGEIRWIWLCHDFGDGTSRYEPTLDA